MQKIFSKQMIVLMAVTFLYMCSLSMTNPVMAGLCALLGGGGVMMGIVGGLSSFVSLFCRPFLGDLIDRQDRRRLGLIGLAGMGFGGIICAFAPNVWILFFGRLCAGLGLAISSSTFSTWVAASLPPEQMGQGMGIYGVIQALSMAFAPALGIWLASLASSRLTCFVAAVMNLLSVFMVLPLVDEHYQKRVRSPEKQAAVKRQFFVPELFPIALLMFLFCVPYNGTTAFLETSIADKGLTFSAGPYFTIFAIALLITRSALSKYLDSYPYRFFVWVCIPFGVLSMLCLQWMHSFGALILSSIFLTLSYGIIQPVSQAASIRSVPEEQQGVANCTYYIGMDLGMALGPTIAGGIYQGIGNDHLFFAMAIFPFLAVFVLLFCKKFLRRL